MANRFTTHILKNSDVTGRPLPSTLLKGEPIVNSADGILYFSGVTQSTNGWTPAGTGTTANFFEVGSNLYDLNLRNRITKYSGISGAGLAGKFLSGTTNGFVLNDISAIAGIDTYLTGGTYSNSTGVATYTNNVGSQFTVSGFFTGSTDTKIIAATFTNNILTLTNNTGGTVSTLINTFTGLTVNGSLNATTISATTYLNLPLNSDVRVTGGTYSNGSATFTNSTGGTFNVGGFFTGSTEVFVTGGTSNDSTKLYTFTNNTGGTFNVNALTDIRVTGGTYSNGTAIFTNNTGGTFNVSGLYTGGTDTYTTGFTYTPAQNKISIAQNAGQPVLDIFVTTVSGLTVSDLTANRVVYSTTNGKLITGTATFDGTNMVLPSAGSLSVGTGGLIVGSGGSPSVAGTGDLIVNGNLTVFGNSFSAFTSQLYVEDSNISINYNPTGNTTATSLGAGFTVQDGNGVSNGSVNLEIRAMNAFTGLTATQVPNISEYTGSTGYSNRAWVTQLNDIVVRSNDLTKPNGVRLLAEFDILDGGSY